MLVTGVFYTCTNYLKITFMDCSLPNHAKICSHSVNDEVCVLKLITMCEVIGLQTISVRAYE